MANTFNVKEILKDRKDAALWRRAVALLSASVMLFTVYALMLPAITMDKTAYCGVEEHRHNDSCYEQRLICGQEEQIHEHDASCYAYDQKLVCGQEAAPAQDDAADAGPEETEAAEAAEITEADESSGNDASGHLHTDACYEQQETLICAITDGTPGHLHAEACYETALICEKEEHTHSLSCYSDPSADVESKGVWERTMADAELTGSWADDVLAVAETQLGYTESTKNYIVDEAGNQKGYTRYGAWYGDAYGDWCAMFVSFCLYYAQIPDTAIPYEANCEDWIERLNESEQYASAEDYTPVPGDLVFFDWEGDKKADHVGLVSEIIPATDAEPVSIQTIEGNRENQVRHVTYRVEDKEILGYGILPANPELSINALNVLPFAASAAPDTVQTVDTIAAGITLNLFDYYGNNLDSQQNTVNRPVYNGINRVMATSGQNHLLFLGSGANAERVNPRNGINCYTGGAIALQGIVNNLLNNGYPTLRTNNSSLSYLFDLNPVSPSGSKTIYPNINRLFQKDSYGYYWYNSDVNYAYYNSGANAFTVYNRTYQNSDGSAIGFFPFNDYNANNTQVKPNNSPYNHHFGLTMTADFIIPENSQVNGRDMVFEFSGDDDVWVFIDDVLVLDIGGIHEKVTGSINFKTGAVTVSNATAASCAGSSGTIGTNSTLTRIFERAGQSYDSAEYSEHTISFFYLERGGCYSNCSLKFNLYTYQKKSLEIAKELTGQNAAAFSDNRFLFQLYLEAGTGSNDYEVYTGPAQYDDGTSVEFDANGVFSLKAGQTVIVPEIIDTKTYYIKELQVDGRDFSSVKVNGIEVLPESFDPDDPIYEIKSSVSTIRDRAEIIFNNILNEEPKEPIEIVVEKEWSDDISTHSADSVHFQLLRNGEPVEYNGESLFTLSAANNWRMQFTEFLSADEEAQDTYTVLESPVNGYNPVYSTHSEEGRFLIHILNEKEPEPMTIGVVKRWFACDGTELMMNELPGISVELWRKYCPSSNGHIVTFNVYVKEDDGSITIRSLGTFSVADGSDLTFIAPLWYGVNPSDVSSANGNITQSGTHITPEYGNAAVYAVNDIVSDITITIRYSADGAYWINPDHYRMLLEGRFQVLSHSEPSSESDISEEDQWIQEFVQTVILRPENNWSYHWTASELPAQTSDGYSYFYYVKEIEIPDYIVLYENNEGIQEGVITIKNTAAIGFILPETGGSGLFLYSVTGTLLISFSLGYLSFRFGRRRKCGRRGKL